jgi:type 1 fimbriae regulatory protein FimB/type 1 fimbriae regulatory protein FimE
MGPRRLCGFCTILPKVTMRSRLQDKEKRAMVEAALTTKKPKVRSNRPKYVTPAEVDQLVAAARESGRYGWRDGTMILMAYRHGLRACEVCELRWWQVNLAGTLEVQRAKKGTPSTHPLHGDEIRALRRLRREFPVSDHVFVTERGGPFSTDNFAAIVKRAGRALGMRVHPHMLRHGCGFSLANQGRDTRSLQAFLGHKNIQNTVIYTDMAVTRFKGWKA